MICYILLQGDIEVFGVFLNSFCFICLDVSIVKFVEDNCELHIGFEYICSVLGYNCLSTFFWGNISTSVGLLLHGLG